MTNLKFTRRYKTGGGAYITKIQGVEILIERQYESNVWIAQSYETLADGKYVDIESTYLESIKSELNSIANA